MFSLMIPKSHSANTRQFIISINLGAVEMGRKHKCTPLQSLDCKEFCIGYLSFLLKILTC